MRHLSPHEVAALAERMAQRRGKTLKLLPETRELVIEALRFYARMRAPEPQLFKVVSWDWKDSHVEEVVASASLIMIGKAAFAAAVEQYPAVDPEAGREGDRKAGWGARLSGRLT